MYVCACVFVRERVCAYVQAFVYVRPCLYASVSVFVCVCACLLACVQFLQALGLQASREVGPFLQPDHELVAMHLVICSTPLRNSVRSGYSLHSWPMPSRPAFCLWIWHQPRPTFDPASYRFSCTHFTPILFSSYLVQ